MEGTERRARIVAERIRETGIDDVLIERLVRTFYDRIRMHAVLGPIFNERVDDWEHHIRQLCLFWSSVALGSGAYGGSPMQKHLALPVDARHFDLWIDLFRKTVHDVCPPKAADVFIERAHRIAASLEMGIAAHHKVMSPDGGRLRRPDADVYLPDERV